MKKRILVDMDGVLADVYKSLINYQYTQKGINMTEQELMGVEERTAFPDITSIVCSNRFFYHSPLMVDSVEGLKYLNDRYELLIVSSATEFSGCLNDKQQWLEEHFPFIHFSQMIFCGRKDCIQGDIMIDDHPKNLDHFCGERYIFTQPHNADLNNESRSEESR